MSHGGGGGQERWLVSYADMVTLLMALFIVMYAMSQMDNGKYDAVKGGLSKALGGGNQIVATPGLGDGISVPIPLEEINGSFAERIDPLEGIGSQLYADFAADGRFSVWLSDRGLTISLVGSAAFDSGDAKIKPEYLPLLDAIVVKLLDIENDISVEGFTDSDPIQTTAFPSNWYLSAARSNEVRNHLENKGVDPDRLIVVGYGETRPLRANDTLAGKATNRRVDVVVLREKVVIDRGKEINNSNQ